MITDRAGDVRELMYLGRRIVVPHKLIDRFGVTWSLQTTKCVYWPEPVPGFPAGHLLPSTYPDLSRIRGPLRKITPVTADHTDACAQVLAEAGTRAGGSLAVSVLIAAQRLDRTRRPRHHLAAGHPTSHATGYLLHTVLPVTGPQLIISPPEWSQAAVSFMAAKIMAWIDGDPRVDVVTALPWVFARAAELHPGGADALVRRAVREDPALWSFLTSRIKTVSMR